MSDDHVICTRAKIFTVQLVRWQVKQTKWHGGSAAVHLAECRCVTKFFEDAVNAQFTFPNFNVYSSSSAFNKVVNPLLPWLRFGRKVPESLLQQNCFLSSTPMKLLIITDFALMRKISSHEWSYKPGYVAICRRV